MSNAQHSAAIHLRLPQLLLDRIDRLNGKLRLNQIGHAGPQTPSWAGRAPLVRMLIEVGLDTLEKEARPAPRKNKRNHNPRLR